MERLVVVGVVVALAVVVALVLQRRGRGGVETAGWAVPERLRREDFGGPPAPWLVVVFTERTCRTCAAAVDAARAVEADDVVVEEVELAAAPALHERYGIDAVPTLVIADAGGAVRASFVGPPTAADLAETLTDLRP